jgi:hypothetical protein
MRCSLSSATFSTVRKIFVIGCGLIFLGILPLPRAISQIVDSERPTPSIPPAEDWLATLGTTVGPLLADAIRRGRDQAYPQAKPIPAEIRRELAPFFSATLLKKVRYSTEWQNVTAEGALYSLLLATGAEAVTLGEVIIFRDSHYAADPVLWAHELTHVEQYQQRGVTAFATKYLQQGWQMEEEAKERARKIQQQLFPSRGR